MNKLLRIGRAIWLLTFCLTSVSSWAQTYRTFTVPAVPGSSTSSVQAAFRSTVNSLVQDMQNINTLSATTASTPTSQQPQNIIWQLVIPPLSTPGDTYWVGNGGALKESPIEIHLPALNPDTNTPLLYAGIEISSGTPNVVTSIKYIDNLQYGIFNSKTYYIGNFIDLKNCHNVTIRDLSVDGNKENYVLGGTNSPHGYQLDNDGIFLSECRTVNIGNVTCAHFGRDGIQVNSHLATPTPANPATDCDNVTITDSHFDYNARQGMSWTGGCGLLATRCTFSHTGRGGAFINGPTAGIDIEPEGGYFGVNLAFKNCHIKDNYGRGVLSDADPDFIFKARNVSFDSCTINSYRGGPAVWTVRPNFTYTNCNIIGLVQGCYYGSADAALATRFTDCHISDTYIDAANVEHPTVISSSGGDNYLLSLYRRCIQTRFTRCEFYAGNLNLSNIDLHGVQDTTQWVIFEDCRFNLGYKDGTTQQQSWGGGGGTSRFCGVIFKGENIIRDENMGDIGGYVAGTSTVGPINKGWRNSFGSVLITSGSAHAGKLTLDTGFKAGHLLELDNETFTIGKTEDDVASLVLGTHDDYLPGTTTLVKAGAYMLLANSWPAPIIRVGTKAMIHVQEGAHLRGQDGDKLYLNGRLIVEKNAYLCLPEYFQVLHGPKNEVYIHKDAVIGQDTRRLPTSVFGTFGNLCVALTCVHGGNPFFTGRNGFLCTEGLKFKANSPDCVTVPDNPKLNFGTGDFSIDLAFKMPPASVSANRPMIMLAKGTGNMYNANGTYVTTVQTGYGLYMLNNALHIVTKNAHYTSNGVFANNGCYRVLVTRNSGSVAVWANETSSTTWSQVSTSVQYAPNAPSGPDNLTSTEPLRFGWPEPNYSFIGILDEVHLWNVAQTSYTDVQTLSMPVAGLVGAWSMQQPNGFIRYNANEYPCNQFNNYEEVPDLSQVMPADRLSGIRSVLDTNRWVTRFDVRGNEEGLVRPNLTVRLNRASIFMGMDCGTTTARGVAADTGQASSAQASEAATSLAADGLQASITPMPFTDSATLLVQSNTSAPVEVVVMEISGKTVSRLHNVALNQELSFGSTLPAGMYFVHISQAGKVNTMKLVKN